MQINDDNNYADEHEGKRPRHGSRTAVHSPVCPAHQPVQRVHLRVSMVLDPSCLSSQRLQVTDAARLQKLNFFR